MGAKIKKEDNDRVRKYKRLPDVGEYVMATITDLNPGSALAVLDEYGDARAMIHISEISSRWVKDIKRLLKVGQKVVAVVINLDNRGYIELSIKRVKPTMAREKSKEYKNEKRAHNFLKRIAQELGYSLDKVYELFGFVLQKEYGSMFYGFEVLAEEGKEPFLKLGIPKDIVDKAYDIALENIKPKRVNIKGDISLVVYEGDGVNVIRDALYFDDKDVIVKYISAGKYRVEVGGEEYKDLERKLAGLLQVVKDKIKKYHASFDFQRIKS